MAYMTFQLTFNNSQISCCFFFQAEDGIRDADVTGVQTCALPISVGNLARQLDHQPGDVRAELPTADRFDRIDVDRQGSHRPVIQGVLEIEDETVRPVHQLAPVPWPARRLDVDPDPVSPGARKSTRLNSSHVRLSYAR